MALENVDDVYPLTPMQRLMLVHAASESGSVGASASEHTTSLLDNQFRYEIDGPLDVARFEQAWNAVIRRHAALRTAVLWNGLDKPLQVVRTRVALPFSYVALDAEPSDARRARLEAVCAADAAQPHDLARAPLMRCTLVRMSPDRHHFIWNVHHLVVDRWSHELIFADVTAFYLASATGTDPELEPAGQFRDYLAWLQRRSDDEAEDFWRRELGGFRRASLLTRSSPERAPGPRARTSHALPSDRVRMLEQRATEWKTTSSSILQAGLALALARRTRTADVAWGLTVSGRTPELERVESTVGSFVGNVPVRVRLDPAQAIGDWVRQLQAAQVARQPFEHVSPAIIREAAPLPPADPLFDLLVVVNQDARRTRAATPPFTMRPAGATFDGAYPLVLGILIQATGVECTLVHDAGFTDGPELLRELTTGVNQLIDAPPTATLADVMPELPAPGPRADVADVRAAPVSPTSADDITNLIHGIWCEVLGIGTIGLDDGLFELGGSSLQATRIFAMLERRLGRNVPLSILLTARTIRTLAQALGGDAATAPRDNRSEPIPAATGATTNAAPLSFAQERLWVLDQLEGASAVYNMAEAFRLRGAVDATALRSALEQLLDRHAVLRAAYPARDGEAVQTLLETGLDWGSEDARNASSPDAVQARLDLAAWEPFQLETGPLIRARLIRVAEHEQLLLLSMHHSVSDGWSVGIIKGELGQLYNAIVRGETAALPALPIAYADFARWQREQLQGERLETLVTYWRDALDGISPLDLPTDRPRPPVQSYRGGVLRTLLKPELVARLRAFSKQEGTTLNMTLTAAFHLLLARYSGQTDIVVGAPFAGRTRVDTEPIVGMFVNTLAIRSSCAADRTFRELLHEVRTRSLEAHARQELPFEKLVQELQPVRDLSRNPIVQTFFSLQDTPDHALALDDVVVTEEQLDQQTAKFDLSLYLRDARSPVDSGGLEGIWEFASDLFDQSTVARMHGHFETLLGALADDPAQRIGTLPLMGAAERHALLVEWNDTAVARAPVPNIQSLVEQQAARSPGAPAVSDVRQTLSYSELDSRANQLAHHLRAEGVRSETLTAIRLARSVESVVAMLAVLKAGAAFLPLDPVLPSERAAYMLDNASADFVVTTSDLLGSSPDQQLRTVCLDRDAAAISGCSTERPALAPDPQHLAYVIYTSGSTGRPKGVQVTHANLVHFLLGMAERPGLSDREVVLSIATLAFDIALLELLGPLSVGGRVRIASEAEFASGEALRALLDTEAFTLMQATPATWHMLLEAGWMGSDRLRALVGAEALSLSLARQLADRCAEVWNMYGPTETTVWASCWRVPPDGDVIRVGRPIGNVRMYVLDAAMQPVPQGVPGQLYIAGAGVALGYRGSATLTAAQYLPDPFSTDPTARLYHTGDRVRLGADGELEYLGRTDRQVKIRGHRIELGEIEGVLTEHDGIRQCLVTGHAMGTLDARLVAYVVLESGAAATPSEIRRHLRKRLPDYMVPGFVLELEAFPRTPNGKINRKALPDPLSSTVRAASEYSPPNTASETLIARVWSDLLDRERVGRKDNFYELGGHSLLGLKAAAAIRRASGADLNPRAMFFQTLEQLAAQLDSTKS